VITVGIAVISIRCRCRLVDQ